MSTSLKATLAMVVAAVVIIVGALALTRGGDDRATDEPTPTATDTERPEIDDPETDDPETDGAEPGGGDTPAAGEVDLLAGDVPGSEAPYVASDSPVLSEGTEATFVEFLDFECEACGALFPVVEDLRAEYGDRVRFVVRYLPLHTNSLNAFQAAEAARAQGQFEQMYVLLFERQADWSHADEASSEPFFAYAEELGLDMDQFADDFESREIAERIEASVADADELGVLGTPTFFVNGEQLEPQSFEDLTDSLDAALD